MAVKSHFSEVQIALLLDNKHEYTEHICDNLSDVLVKVFQEVYEKAYKSPLGRNKGALEAFQLECEGVVSWNAELVSQLFKRIPNPSFPKLLKMVFMTTIKAILAQHGLRLEGRLHVRIPGAEHFVHKCAIEMARSVWKRPYLYYHKVRSLERQRNLHECDLIARKAIRIVLRQSIPMEQILQEIEMANVSDVESQSTEDSEILLDSVEEDKSRVEIKLATETEAESDIDASNPSTYTKEDTDEEGEVEEKEDIVEQEDVDENEDTEEVEKDDEVEEEVDTDEEGEVEEKEDEVEQEDTDETEEAVEKEDEVEQDVVNKEDEKEKTVEWIPRNATDTTNEAIEVEKNELHTLTDKPETVTPTVEIKTTLMGTRHLINPKRIKFVGSGKKDSFF